MKLTFPYMGSPIIYKKLLELFGHEVVMPPRPTKRTIDLGVKYSPEFACFPYKVIMGSYIEAIERGADTIVTSGGSGPCRAGFYSEVHKKTLQSMGYDLDFIVFDDFGRDPKRFINNIRKIKGKSSWFRTLKNIFIVYKFAHAIDKLQRIVEIKRAYELNKGSFTRAFEGITRRFDREVNSLRDIKRLYREGLATLNSIQCREVPDRNRIRVGIVGEIFVVMESSINMNIAEVLNDFGCEVSRSMYISEWTDHSIWPKFFVNRSGSKIIKKSRRYVELGIGGHEQHNIGNIILFKEGGYNGVVHLMPFACLPELITQSIIPQISQDWDIPVLTLAIDEQTGIANNLTRIEAFVELIKNIKFGKTA